MARYEVSKHPDYLKRRGDKTWLYILLAVIALFLIWLFSRL
ncbi:MAG: hypothetical protein R6U32_07280 [Candidatus Woesearchaeota archaeon]